MELRSRSQAFTSIVVAAGAGRRPGGKLTPGRQARPPRLALAVEASELLAGLTPACARGPGPSSPSSPARSSAGECPHPHETNEPQRPRQRPGHPPGAPSSGARRPNSSHPPCRKWSPPGATSSACPSAGWTWSPRKAHFKPPPLDQLGRPQHKIPSSAAGHRLARLASGWLYIWDDYETLANSSASVRNIVTATARSISTWTVVGGLHTNTNFSFSSSR